MVVNWIQNGEPHQIAYAKEDFDYMPDPRSLIAAFYGVGDLSDAERKAAFATIEVVDDES